MRTERTRQWQDTRPVGAPVTSRPGQCSQVMVTPVGLKIPAGISFEGWMRAGRRLSALATSTAWCLGDWILFGQARYGEKYREAVETVGLDYQTLRNYTWVARAVAMPRRRENLSFQHHAEVASLSDTEQDYWLRRAEENRWSRNELRRQVRAAALGRDDAGPPSVQVRLNAVADRLDRWRAAADRSGTTVEAWLVKCADAAADQLLDVPEESMT